MDHLGARLFIIQVFTYAHHACAKYSKARDKNVKFTNQILISNSFSVPLKRLPFVIWKHQYVAQEEREFFYEYVYCLFIHKWCLLILSKSGNIENVCFSLYIYVCYSLLIWFQERRQYKQEPSFLRLLAYFQHINGALL